MADEFGELRDRLKRTYRRAADERGPSDDEIKDAFSTLTGAWSQVASAVTAALKDPDVRDQMKSAASSFAAAVGRTISELGTELTEGPLEEE